MHKFHIYGKEFGIHYPGGALYSDDPNDVRIDASEFEPGDRFIYTYNYFDNLVYDIRVESMVHPDESDWVPDCIGGNRLTDRDSWSPPECPFDCVDSINDLTMNELIERLTFIIEQYKPPKFCRHAVNRHLVDACRQSALSGSSRSSFLPWGGFTVDITLSLTIIDGDESVIQQDIIHLSKSFHPDELIGLSLDESKQLLKTLQQQIVEFQASQYFERWYPGFPVANNENHDLHEVKLAA